VISFQNLAAVFLAIVGPESELLRDLTKEGIEEILMRLHCNSFQLGDTNGTWGCYPTISYINHHCQPNCTWYLDRDGNLLLESTKAIQKDAQITISYGGIATTSTNLQENCKKYMKKEFLFDCNCPSVKG